MRPSAALRRGLYALCVLYFALWACGPALSGPPPVPMAEGRVDEVGLSPHLGVAWPEPAEPVTTATPSAPPPPRTGLTLDCAQPLQATCAGPSGQLWYRHRFERFDVGGVLFGGRPTLIGAGALFRWRFVEEPGVIVALQADGGFLWGSLGVPVAWAITDRTWLSLHPQVAFKTWSPLRLGTGLTHTTRDGLLLGLELAAGVMPGETRTFDAGFHLGYQFPARRP